MDIPLHAQVECRDGVCGRSEYVLMNPVLEQVTHLVVRDDSRPHTEFIVPVGAVSQATATTIGLSCSKAELEEMDQFVQTEFVEEKMPERYPGYGGGYGVGSLYYWPYSSYEVTVRVPVDHLEVPAGELAVRRGTRVKAMDGDVGHVDEFLINPENGHITHLVMREGHLWGQKDVTIPLSAIGETSEDTVLLKISKHEIESLPTVPVHRRWS